MPNGVTRRPIPLSILAAALASSLALGCADATAPASPPSVQGTWSYSESFTDMLNGMTCADSGTYDLVQSGGKFSGTYAQRGACRTTDRQVIDISDRGPVTDGSVSGRHILFKAPGCAYDGLIRVNDESHVEGTVVCTASLGGTDFHFSGNWSAHR